MRKTWSLVLFFAVIIWAFPVYAALDGYDLAAENEFLQLYLNEETAEIAVYHKETDSFWYSNPPNRSVEETVARGRALDRLGAQVFLTYFTQVGAEVTLDNYNDSIVYQQIEVTPIEQGVRLEFTFGQEWQEDAYVPNIMPADRFEQEILARVEDEKDREFLLEEYTLIWFEDAPPGYTPVSVTQIDKAKVLGNKTLMAQPKDLERRNAKRDLYDALFDHIVGRSDISRRSQITPEIMETFMETPLYMLGNRVSRWARSDIAQIIRDIGFTPQDRVPDLERFGFPEIMPNHRVFRVTIEYYLDGQDFVVRVPLDEVSYPIDAIDPSDQEAPPVTLPVYSITVLPYFGAANQEQEGYIVVPDGSGALIYLNNGKSANPSVVVNVYGRDGSISQTEKMRYLVNSNLPVFGMKQGDYGFIAIMEQGEATARVRADVAGRAHSYNVVYPEFVIRPKDSAYLQTTDEFTKEVVIAVPQSRPVEGDLQVRYSFLFGDEATYVGMAHHYQKYLQQAGMEPVTAAENIPFYLELIGSVQVKRPILGVPQTVVEPLTSYEQVREIVDELTKAGVDNIHVRYGGWLNGGIDHDFPTRVKWEKAVGGKRGLLELVDYLEGEGVKFFPDVSFLTVSKNSVFDGFLTPRDAALFLDRSVAKVYEFDRATYQAKTDRFRYVLSPKRLDKVVDGFLQDYSEIGLSTLSLGDLASELHSDFRYKPEQLIDRQQAKQIVVNQLEKMADYELMLNGGFAYGLPFAEHVVNVPGFSNKYPLTDETIPFYQIVTRGFVNHAGEPVNYSQDIIQNRLNTIETGGFPYYVWSYIPSSHVKHTDYDFLYSLYYKDWLEDAVQFYHEVNQVLKPVQGQRIVDHKQVQKGVYKTVYENGIYTLVNYNNTAVVYEGVFIGSQSYAIVEGGN